MPGPKRPSTSRSTGNPPARQDNTPEVLTCADAAQWESWLAKHHEHSNGVWLKIAKKGSGQALISISEALDVALCFGWIDSQRKGQDEHSYLQRYSRRTSRSPWSKLNVERVEGLIATKRLRAPGLAEVVAAKADGRWAVAYESQRTAELPSDLAAALHGNKPARTVFEQLDKTAQYAVILPILKATTPKIRETRIQKAVTLLEAGSLVLPLRGRGIPPTTRAAPHCSTDEF